MPKSALVPKGIHGLEAMARATITGESAEISLRVPRGDLMRLKSRAMQEGEPVRAVIASLTYKYVAVKGGKAVAQSGFFAGIVMPIKNTATGGSHEKYSGKVKPSQFASIPC